MDLLYPAAGVPVAIAGGLLVIVSTADLSYRLVERPAQRLARRLLGQHRRPVPAATAESPPAPTGSGASAGVSAPAGR
jgi:peptidoglycan/LPS O-acetylase OafA/YrhL